MRFILLSPPHSRPDEQQLVVRILQQSPAVFHLRKPRWAADDLARYLQRIPDSLHTRIMVHDHWELLDRFDLRGIHFTENARRDKKELFRQVLKEKSTFRFSSAFHRTTDIAKFDGGLDYLFLSPIFDSISKPDYPAAFTPMEVRPFLQRTDHHVIALGGVHGERIFTAADLGFAGVAVLGAVWGSDDPVAAALHLAETCERFIGSGSA